MDEMVVFQLMLPSLRNSHSSERHLNKIYSSRCVMYFKNPDECVTAQDPTVSLKQHSGKQMLRKMHLLVSGLLPFQGISMHCVFCNVFIRISKTLFSGAESLRAVQSSKHVALL